MLQSATPTRQASTKTAAQTRLDALAALWARQTGRSIVVSYKSAR